VASLFRRGESAGRGDDVSASGVHPLDRRDPHAAIFLRLRARWCRRCRKRPRRLAAEVAGVEGTPARTSSEPGQRCRVVASPLQRRTRSAPQASRAQAPRGPPNHVLRAIAPLVAPPTATGAPKRVPDLRGATYACARGDCWWKVGLASHVASGVPVASATTCGAPAGPDWTVDGRVNAPTRRAARRSQTATTMPDGSEASAGASPSSPRGCAGTSQPAVVTRRCSRVAAPVVRPCRMTVTRARRACSGTCSAAKHSAILGLLRSHRDDDARDWVPRAMLRREGQGRRGRCGAGRALQQRGPPSAAAHHTAVQCAAMARTCLSAQSRWRTR
jgi:hypothetical protein